MRNLGKSCNPDTKNKKHFKNKNRQQEQLIKFGKIKVFISSFDSLILRKLFKFLIRMFKGRFVYFRRTAWTAI